MMGLNILPKDSKKSHHLQPSYEEVSTICQVPVTQNDAGCVFYQDKRTQSGHCSSETGILIHLLKGMYVAIKTYLIQQVRDCTKT